MIGVWPNAEVALASALAATALTCSLATSCQSDIHPRDIRSVQITLERTACYGVCPAYTVTLHGNGLVEYTGKLRVDIPGPQTRTVNPGSLRDLLRIADQIHFFEMQGSYSELCTDLPTSIVSILVDGKTKRVSNYYGGCEHQSRGPQVELARLAQKIDEAAGTAHWVKCDYPSPNTPTVEAGHSPDCPILGEPTLWERESCLLPDRLLASAWSGQDLSDLG